MKKLLFILFLPIGCFVTTTTNTQSIATLSSSCFFNVQNLNFGNYFTNNTIIISV